MHSTPSLYFVLHYLECKIQRHREKLRSSSSPCRCFDAHFYLDCSYYLCVRAPREFRGTPRTFRGFLDGSVLKRVCLQCGRPGLEKIPWRRKWQPTPVFLLGEFHGQRSLEGYSPWSHKQSSKRYPSRLESRAGFFASTRDGCLSPRVRLECNPEFPFAPGEEHWLLDTA